MKPKKAKRPQDATLVNVRAAKHRDAKLAQRLDAITMDLVALDASYHLLEDRIANIEGMLIGTGTYCATYTWDGKKQKKRGKK